MDIFLKDYKTLTKEEHAKLLSIRNQKEVREASNDTNEIIMQNHLEWVKKLQPKRYFAVFYKDKIVGGVNFDADGKTVTNWGIFFDKSLEPLVSLMAVYSFMEYLFGFYDTLYSEVKKENQKALSFNRYFGVEILEETATHYKMYIDKHRWQEWKKKLKSLSKRVGAMEVLT